MNFDIEPLLLNITLLKRKVYHHRGVLCETSDIRSFIVGVLKRAELDGAIRAIELTIPNFQISMTVVTTAHSAIGFQVYLAGLPGTVSMLPLNRYSSIV